jgi:Fur family ferric uptake transcriptional regulator
MTLTLTNISGAIRKSGYRLTPQRQAVLETILESQNHLTPVTLHKRAKERYPKVGKVTIYRTLELLIKLGFLCKVHSETYCRNYLIRRPEEHHHHLICSICGKVVDFKSCELEEIEHQLSNETDFVIDDHLLEFYGRCRNCFNNLVT